MRDVRLTTQNPTGVLDIQVENGKANWAYDGTEAAQHGAIRLQKFVDESVIGDSNEDYTKWYKVVFNAAESRAKKEFELKRRILGTTGVVRILTFEWNQEGHEVNIVGSVLTLWGEADISQTVTPL
ncbi:hypothetical protein KAR91_53425 [Candidatus Pacearchaeota archaeon]|nr:hypothetical protein [Candidatus Pacearchaeota archaeon]